MATREGGEGDRRWRPDGFSLASLLVVYSAVAAAVTAGLWSRLGVRDLAVVLVLSRRR